MNQNDDAIITIKKVAISGADPDPYPNISTAEERAQEELAALMMLKSIQRRMEHAVLTGSIDDMLVKPQDSPHTTEPAEPAANASVRSMHSSPVFIPRAGGQKPRARKLTNREKRRARDQRRKSRGK